MENRTNSFDNLINKVKKRRVTTKDLVTDAIREAILKGYIKNGEEIETNDLTNKFGVSRMPIRLALEQLESEGLVYMEPHKKAVAVKLSPDEIKKISEICCELEGLAIRTAVPNITEDVFIKLSAILDEMEKCTDPEEYMSLNSTFHDTIYEYSYNKRLCKLIRQLRNNVERYAFFLDKDHFQTVNNDHALIYNALVKFDAKKAEEYTRTHLFHTRDSIVDLLNKSG